MQNARHVCGKMGLCDAECVLQCGTQSMTQCVLDANAKQLFHLVKFSSQLSRAHSQGVADS